MKALFSGIVLRFQTIRLLLRCAPHLAVVGYRQAMGRWFYFRDRPHWFVNLIAELEPNGGASDEMRAIVTEARAERKRRAELALREVEKLSPFLAQLLRGQEFNVQIGGDGT